MYKKSGAVRNWNCTRFLAVTTAKACMPSIMLTAKEFRVRLMPCIMLFAEIHL